MKVNNNTRFYPWSAYSPLADHISGHRDTPEDAQVCFCSLEKTDGHDEVQGTLLASRKVEGTGEEEGEE